MTPLIQAWLCMVMACVIESNDCNDWLCLIKHWLVAVVSCACKIQAFDLLSVRTLAVKTADIWSKNLDKPSAGQLPGCHERRFRAPPLAAYRQVELDEA